MHTGKRETGTGSEIKPIGTSGPVKSPPKRLYLSIKLYGFRYHKTIVLIFTVIRISNLVVLEEFECAASVPVRLLLYQCTGRAIKLTAVIIEAYQCYQLLTEFYPISFSQG
jgi:hypothetical protein